MGVESALPDPMNSVLRKKPWKNHWIAPSPTRDGWSQPAPCSHDLSLQAQVHACTLTSKTQPTSWFQKGFRGLANVASWPRSYRWREGMKGGGVERPKILTRPANRKCKEPHFSRVYESSHKPDLSIHEYIIIKITWQSLSSHLC